MRNYKRVGITEQFRQFLRSVDFCFMLLFIYMFYGGKFRNDYLIEFGPGPTPLINLKNIFFKKILLFDFRLYDQKNTLTAECHIFDLNEDNHAELDRILSNLYGAKVVFSDHCFEHIKPEKLQSLLKIVRNREASIFFRVPNIMSDNGRKNYFRDNTHINPFDSIERLELERLGYKICPWIRFYRIGDIAKIIFYHNHHPINYVEEILVIKM